MVLKSIGYSMVISLDFSTFNNSFRSLPTMMRMNMIHHALLKCMFSLFVIFLCMSAASADLIEPGKKLVQVEYKLTNIISYPTYVFLLYTFAPMVGYRVIKSGDSIGGYKLSEAYIYAIKNSDYLNVHIGDSDREIKQFFKNNTHLIRSNVQLLFSGKQVPEIDPLVSQTINLQIDLLNQTFLEIQLSSISYQYNDGTIEKVTYSNHDAPLTIINPSNLPEPPVRLTSWIWFLLIPFLAIFGLVFIIKITRKRDS